MRFISSLLDACYRLFRALRRWKSPGGRMRTSGAAKLTGEAVAQRSPSTTMKAALRRPIPHSRDSPCVSECQCRDRQSDHALGSRIRHPYDGGQYHGGDTAAARVELRETRRGCLPAQSRRGDPLPMRYGRTSWPARPRGGVEPRPRGGVEPRPRGGVEPRPRDGVEPRPRG
jgi:hypothetical protein